MAAIPADNRADPRDALVIRQCLASEADPGQNDVVAREV
jgi:hypothetical protein